MGIAYKITSSKAISIIIIYFKFVSEPQESQLVKTHSMNSRVELNLLKNK
jgi:hypothetical protein